MQNKSKTIVAVLILVIVALLIIVGYTQRKHVTPQLESDLVSQSTQERPSQSGTSHSENLDLGISFAYPSSWGSLKESTSYYKTPFEYTISFTNSDVHVAGLSYPYTSAGRDGYEADLKETTISGEACAPHSVESVTSKTGVTGVYTQSQVVAGLGECSDYPVRHYAVFDSINKKISNVVIYADADKISKEDFLKFVTSMSF